MLDFANPLQLVAVVCLTAALGLLGGGWASRTRRSHLVLIAGEALYILYWLLMVPHFFETADYVNAFFSALSLPFFAYIMYHHWLCYRWDEEVDSLRWVAGTTFITSALYFSMLYIDVIAKAVIWLTATLTVVILGGFGYEASLGVWTYGAYGGHALVVVGDSPMDNWINIVMACTGMQAIALFLGGIAALRPNRGVWDKWARDVASGKEPVKGPLAGYRRGRLARLLKMSDRERLLRAVMYTAPVIFVSNLARNVAIIFLVYEGHIDFYTAHHIYAKSLAFLLLIVLTLACFAVLPELQENILGIMDLKQRRKKGDIGDGFVRMDVIREATGERDAGEDDDTAGDGGDDAGADEDDGAEDDDRGGSAGEDDDDGAGG